MFGADTISGRLWEEEVDEDGYDNQDYLFPRFSHPNPWMKAGKGKQEILEDFILIAEFSEQEGPRPVIIIPKDGGQTFDHNEFCVKILAVDHQSSVIDGFHVTEDTQVVMSDTDHSVHAFVHHIVLHDFNARGYVRPFCISYVTQDSRKIMACYEQISQQITKVAKYMKYGNRLVFVSDLENYLEDLQHTKANLLRSHGRGSDIESDSDLSPADTDLLTSLNCIHHLLEEVRGILDLLKPSVGEDNEIEERFRALEAASISARPAVSCTSTDTGSLQDFRTHPHTGESLCGSYNESTVLCQNLFRDKKDYKPKLLDLNLLKGKRKFDYSLRGFHELCSWGAKEGLQRLRMIREFFKRETCTLELEELDRTVLNPSSGVLSFGQDFLAANFLCCDALTGEKSCYIDRNITCNNQNKLQSWASYETIDSFHSVSSSYQSFEDIESLESVRSSFGIPSPIKRLSNQFEYGSLDRDTVVIHTGSYDPKKETKLSDKLAHQSSSLQDSGTETVTQSACDVTEYVNSVNTAVRDLELSQEYVTDEKRPPLMKQDSQSSFKDSSSEKSGEARSIPESFAVKHRKKLKNKLFKEMDQEHKRDSCLRKVLCGYNNLQHVVYCLLSGRPVVVIGTRKMETQIREVVSALKLFLPCVSGCDHVMLLCQLRQLKLVDLHSCHLQGIIRSEKKSVDFIIPHSIRRYLTFLDLDKMLVCGQPYQGKLLSFISAIFQRKKSFKSEEALQAYLHCCLMEISSKAMMYYQCVCMAYRDSTPCSSHMVPRKSCQFQTNSDHFLSHIGVRESDCHLVQYLSEVIELQQMEEDFKSNGATDVPAHPLTVQYHQPQMFKC